MKRQTNNQLFKVYAHYQRLAHYWRSSQSDNEITKNIFEVLRCSGGEIVSIEKSGPLAKEFWIGEGYSAGRTYDEAQSICKDINRNKQSNFILTNTERFDRIIERLNRYIEFLNGSDICISSSDIFYFTPEGREQDASNPLRYIVNFDACYLEEKANHRRLSLEDAYSYRAALIRQRGEQVKRCKAYIKRYGTDRIHARTYWADR